ncbi:MAG TPA: hypothetical protein VKD02_04745 [Methyloceanibacter sp.]|nr:hypothetical protein [Methyloceanibacter sp.]
MVHPLIKIGAALALGGVIFACPAFAVSPPSPNTRPSLLIPVQDEENEEVWRDLRPDITPPPAAIGEEGKVPPTMAPERPKEEGKSSGDTEEKELKEDGLIPE